MGGAFHSREVGDQVAGDLDHEAVRDQHVDRAVARFSGPVLVGGEAQQGQAAGSLGDALNTQCAAPR